MKIQQSASPLYQVSYRRNGQVYENKEALFASWTPDTLDKSLGQKDATVDVNFTKLRNHTVGEALKDTASDVAPGLFVLVPLMGAVGTLFGVGAEMFGHAGAALTGGLIGAGSAVGLLGLAGVAEYRGMRSDAGQTTCEFSGTAYRERPDQQEVKLVRGDSLSYARDAYGTITAGAAPTATGYCETYSLGLMSPVNRK
ncbi:MAG: hypothetical protein J0I12_00780 [Candidatus Eremiobacteraeota bacterium]|nr:hypothetical protein [Candidatus Eremiobacteraeota bacterium]